MLGRRTVLLVFLGSTLLQTAWLAAVPPFRAIDEFDHAYRADSVAHGYWNASNLEAERGRGGVLVVRESIVAAAEPMCSMYDYTGRDNCNPIERLDDGLVTVASGAATYHPVFYWVVGTAALPFEGSGAVYAMRATAALLCSGLIALAAYLLSLTTSTRWPLLAMLVACTPVFMYTTAVGAPNGVEMAAGLVTWIGLLGLTQPRAAGVEGRIIACTTMAAALLVTVRQLGPLWLFLIISTVLFLGGWQRARRLFEERRRWMVGAVLAVGTAAVAALWWVRAAGSLAIDGEVNYPNPVATAAVKVPIWVLQSVAVFPTRNEPAPMPVYAAYIIVGAAALILGLIAAGVRLRICILVGTALSLLVPFVITLATIDEVGTAWQGRYTLPFSIGVLLMLGMALETRPPRNRLIGPGLLGLAVCLALGHVVSVVEVYVSEQDRPAAASVELWPIMPPAAIAIFTAAGLVLWGLAVGSRNLPGRGSAPRLLAEAEAVELVVPRDQGGRSPSSA